METRSLQCINDWWIYIDLFSCQSSPPIDQIEFPCCFACHLPFSSSLPLMPIQFTTSAAKLNGIIINMLNNLLAKVRKRRKEENIFHLKNRLLIEVHIDVVDLVQRRQFNRFFININKITSFVWKSNAKTEDKVTGIQTAVITFDTKWCQLTIWTWRGGKKESIERHEQITEYMMN